MISNYVLNLRLNKGLLIYYGRKHFDYDDTYQIYNKLEELNDFINERLPLIVINKRNFN